MRRIKKILQAGSAAILVASSVAVGLPVPAGAVADAPSLVISQLKITSSNGQFITLYNSTDTDLDMSQYQLEYFNNYDPDKATSSRLINLSGIVPPHGYFMVNDDSLLLCYRLTVDSVSLGFSSTSGFVEILSSNRPGAGGPAAPILQDYIGWSKVAASGAQTLPSDKAAFLQRQPADSLNNPLVAAPGDGYWQTVQPDPANACGLVSGTGSPDPIQTGLSQLLPSAEPPATVVPADGTGTAGLPPTDIGLMAPSITEILPNPDGTGNDSTDEFIELYNPNGTSFDLSGFKLQVGTTTPHDYVFSAGTVLPPQSFKVFYSAATGLSLSNSGGRVKLLDPSGNSISATGVYGSAKDGQAWALANGKWYWTTKSTPGTANVINQPPASKKAVAKTASAKTKSFKPAAAKAKTAKKKAAPSQPASLNVANTIPIHIWTLALVAAAALLYGAYEYRADLANRFYQFRQYFGTRREGRA